MAKFKHKQLDFDWTEAVLEEKDWQKQSNDKLCQMLFELELIRAFENKLLELHKDALIHGPVHTSIGQEAIAVGAMAGIRKEDGISGTHRAHHQYISKACSFYLPDSFNPAKSNIPSTLQDTMNVLLSEIMGLNTGCCKGRGGSMHLCNPKIGVLGTNAIVGGGIPLATGSAFAEKYRKSGNIVVAFFGDGATNQGAFHEALNLAGLWKLPIIFVLENNMYAVATHLAESSALAELSVRAASYGMRGQIVDGNNPLTVKIAFEHAAESMRNGDATPIFMDLKTYRDYHHAGNTPGSAFGYRSREEEKIWKDRDPLPNFLKQLTERKILTPAGHKGIQKHVAAIIENAADFCLTMDNEGKSIVRPSLIPDVSTIAKGLRGDGQEFNNIQFTDVHLLPKKTEMKYVEAIAAVTGRWLEKDPNVFIMGEEVGHMSGGPYLATKGLAKLYPGRVLDTPISECGFCGLAGGAAMNGLRPIAELMFPDFGLVAADQLFNQIGKLRHMYGGSNVDMPVVIRTRIALGCGYGGQHSADPTALFALFSGWRIIAPSTPADYIGLFNSAMQCNDPVLMVEHHKLYNMADSTPDNLDYFIEIGKAKKMSEGTDVTVLTYSWSTKIVEKIVAELTAEGISVEAIDLRTLSMPDIDYDMIGTSFRKTGNMVIVEESADSNSIGARIAYECHRRFFDYIDGPICTVTGLDVPPPVSRWAEAAVAPSPELIKNTIRKSVQRSI